MASYHGHGMAIESLSVKETSELQRLQAENTQLQEEIQYLQQLLAAWQPQPCTLCQLHSSASAGTSSKATRNRAVSSTSSNEAGIAVHAAIDRIIRQQQVLVAQQQRQLLALQVELSSREQVLLEADAVLAEADRRIAALAAWASKNAQQSTAILTQPQQQRATAPGSIAGSTNASAAASCRQLVSSSSQGSRPGTSLSSSTRAGLPTGRSAGGSRVDAAAGNVQQVYGVVLDHCRSLLTWCRESQARMSRSKAASAAQCRGQAATGGTTTSSAGSSRANSRAASSSGGCSKQQQWQSPDNCPPATAEEVAQQLEVTYLPAGGNSFLQPGHSPSLTAIACGPGWSALAAPAVQQLFHQLTCLAAPLAALAVQLRSIILPALPWVQSSQLGAELPSSCAQLAQQAAAAAVQLAQLCALLPATQGTLSATTVTAARQARGQQAAAGADAGGWGSAAAQRQQFSAQGQQQDGASAALALDHEDQVLLQEIASLLPHSGRATSQQAPLHKAAAPAAGKHGAVSSAQAVLVRLQQRLHVLCLKQGVLHDQLAFLAKCSAAQAKLMTRLATNVLQALNDALDAAEPPSVQQQRSRTLQFCSQLQRASLLTQQQQGDNAGASSSDSFRSSAQHARSSSAASSSSAISRTVLTLLESSRDILQDLPRLLNSSSASALKSAATAAVVAALSDFKAGLQP